MNRLPPIGEKKKEYKHHCNLCGHNWIDNKVESECPMCHVYDVETKEVE